MKDKILLFAIGVLVGAVIATGAFFVYSKATVCKGNNSMQMPGNSPSMQNGGNNQNGQPPALPNENDTQNSNEEQSS